MPTSPLLQSVSPLRQGGYVETAVSLSCVSTIEGTELWRSHLTLSSWIPRSSSVGIEEQTVEFFPTRIAEIGALQLS